MKNKMLRPFVKFIWHLEADKADVNYKLLPTDCIDIILNFSGEICYSTDTRQISAPPFHMNGLRSTHSYIHHSGNIRTIGISFHAYGLYPFVNKSLVRTQNQIVDLFSFSSDFAADIRSAASDANPLSINLEQIETALCSRLKNIEKHSQNTNIISDFMASANDITIKDFCKEYNMTVKTFERMVLRYTGYTPKALFRIKRFQDAANQLVHKESSTLTDIAYDNGFADQPHFNREFHSFSGNAPQAFQRKEETIKENAKYIYK